MLNSSGKDTGTCLIHYQMHPPALEFTGIVVGQGQARRAAVGWLGQEARFHQHLKTVADAQNQPARFNKPDDVLAQLQPQLFG